MSILDEFGKGEIAQDTKLACKKNQMEGLFHSLKQLAEHVGTQALYYQVEISKGMSTSIVVGTELTAYACNTCNGIRLISDQELPFSRAQCHACHETIGLEAKTNYETYYGYHF